MKHFLFIGDRWNVLGEIIKRHLPVEIFAVKGSFLQSELKKRKIQYRILPAKESFFAQLSRKEFDVLVSNGCPYILPVSKLKRSGQVFINVHPSLLPELAGRHPVNGAYLLDRNFGATCHTMDDKVDRGLVISRVKVGRARKYDLALAYQLVFLAEAEAFCLALERKFRPMDHQPKGKRTYYTRKDQDMEIDFKDSTPEIVNKIRAFGVPSQGAFFIARGGKFKVMDAEIVKCDLWRNLVGKFSDGEIITHFGNSLLVKFSGEFIWLRNIEGDFETLRKIRKLK